MRKTKARAGSSDSVFRSSLRTGPRRRCERLPDTTFQTGLPGRPEPDVHLGVVKHAVSRELQPQGETEGRFVEVELGQIGVLRHPRAAGSNRPLGSRRPRKASFRPLAGRTGETLIDSIESYPQVHRA